MKSSLAVVPLKNRFSVVTDTVRFSHAGRLGASVMLVGWSTVALNNTAELLLLTSTKYLKVWFPPGGIPVALPIKAIQKMTAVTGVLSSALMTTSRPLGALGGSEEYRSDGVMKYIKAVEGFLAKEGIVHLTCTIYHSPYTSTSAVSVRFPALIPNSTPLAPQVTAQV